MEMIRWQQAKERWSQAGRWSGGSDELLGC